MIVPFLDLRVIDLEEKHRFGNFADILMLSVFSYLMKVNL